MKIEKSVLIYSNGFYITLISDFMFFIHLHASWHFKDFLFRYFKGNKNLVQLNKLYTSMHTFTLRFIYRQPEPIITNVLDTKVFSNINPIKKYQGAQELTPNYCFHIHPANTLTISGAAERLHR